MAQSSGNATLSGKTGPALAISSLAVRNLKNVLLDFEHSVLRMNWQTNAGVAMTTEVDMVLTTTLTDSIASTVHTIVASGS